MRNLHTFKDTGEKCRHCSAAFHERYHLIQHQKTHKSEKKFKCEHCGYTCKQVLCFFGQLGEVAGGGVIWKRGELEWAFLSLWVLTKVML